ncbi:MAG: 30S ribosomal protein S9 [Chloroflexi bacterium]|nr:30S ribosomal protein S9 [Chloroflexota bacterium]
MSDRYFEGVGRRKTSTARVRLFPGGNGQVTVNEKLGREYFARVGDYEAVTAPLRTIGQDGKFNITVVVAGGGSTGQAEATRQGVARALLRMNEDLRKPLRRGGYLTRDSREKERKKPGLKRARKAPTYTKR